MGLFPDSQEAMKSKELFLLFYDILLKTHSDHL